ncbi:oxidoreductase YcjS [Cronobacter sakazakii SP291]|nr:oxidoreductase YcjS [Cronobacter sakazakii SP291]
MSAHQTSPLKVAIIGAGQVADNVHASFYRTREEVQLVAVCDSRPEQAQAFAERHAIRHVFTDVATLLAEVRPDVVSVCSPNRFHHEHVMQALAAGCHVMCEKPPAMTAEQADEMRQAARRSGKVLAYDFHHRFARDTQLLREQVASGTLGDVYVTNARALRRAGLGRVYQQSPTGRRAAYRHRHSYAGCGAVCARVSAVSARDRAYVPEAWHDQKQRSVWPLGSATIHGRRRAVRHSGVCQRQYPAARNLVCAQYRPAVADER